MSRGYGGRQQLCESREAQRILGQRGVVRSGGCREVEVRLGGASSQGALNARQFRLPHIEVVTPPKQL